MKRFRPASVKKEQAVDAYIGEVTTFVNQETGKKTKLIPIYAEAKERFADVFTIIFNPMLYVNTGKDIPSDVLCAIVMKMNKDNVCKMSTSDLAEYFECSKRQMQRKLNILASVDAIKKHRHGIMVNPAFAVKCNAEKYKELIKEYRDIKNTKAVEKKKLNVEWKSAIMSPIRFAQKIAEKIAEQDSI